MLLPRKGTLCKIQQQKCIIMSSLLGQLFFSNKIMKDPSSTCTPIEQQTLSE
jgi:hypothetical protein